MATKLTGVALSLAAWIIVWAYVVDFTWRSFVLVTVAASLWSLSGWMQGKE